MGVEIDFVGEGLSDDAIARRLIAHCGGSIGVSYRRPQRGLGKDSLDNRLRGLNAGAAFGKPVLVLRDLDEDAPCPGALVHRLVPNRCDRLIMRIAVCSAEAWLMADRVGYASYSGVRQSAIPRNLEQSCKLKQVVVDWADSGASTRLKELFRQKRRLEVPDWATLGEWHSFFIMKHWNISRALAGEEAPSLNRAVSRLLEICG